jgi:hypothetical protein
MELLKKMNEIITVLLSLRMAQAYKKDASKAVYLCANKVFKRIQNKNVRTLITQLADRKVDSIRRIKAVERLELALRVEKFL